MRDIWGADLVGEVKSNNTINIFGKKAYVLGADNKKHVARIQGATIEYAYGDEVTTWANGVFEMLKSRLRCKHSCFDGTCNPDNPNHWFKKFLDSDADIYQQAYHIDDGCLPEDVVRELKKEYAGSVFYQRYIEGKWAAAEGLVYDMFNEQAHVIDYEPDLESERVWDGERYVDVPILHVSCDYGIQNATVFLLWGTEKYSGKKICIDEWYYSGRENLKQKTVSELVDGLESMLHGRRCKSVIVDPSASALKVQLRKRKFKVKDADNDVLDGIADVAYMLQAEMMAFHRRCRHTIEEFGIYAWDMKAVDMGEDAPLKESDHGADASRYYIRTMKFVKRDKRLSR